VSAWTAIIVAKSPRPGATKTRLIPALGAIGAAGIAEAALRDTLDAACASTASRVVLALDGPRPGWISGLVEVIPQRGDGLAARLRNVWADVGGPALQIGMDTPQITADLLDACAQRLFAPAVDAVLGPAADGGWWALGLHATESRAFDGVAMSTASTGQDQVSQLRRCGLRVALLPELRDVDTPEDIGAVAAQAPATRFAAAAAQWGARLPDGVAARGTS
jgi:rSAM/selenodomain-associated transferase 1